MHNNFITRIYIKSSRNIKDFEIPLTNQERKHLIITGKNGSGKTSFLNDLFKFFHLIDNGHYTDYLFKLNNVIKTKKEIDELRKQPKSYQHTEPRYLLARIETYQNAVNQLSSVHVDFRDQNVLAHQVERGQFLLAFFGSKREMNLKVPEGITPVELKNKYDINDNANRDFIQYLVNMKADRSFARDDDETETVQKIDAWFNRLENRLRILFDSPSLRLRFDRKRYNFDIIESPDKEPFGFNRLADGYAAIINVISELLLRMETFHQKAYDLQGLVLIDEIEAHLHVHLQRKILPFLTDFFPKIQFIVTTHSPFVLSSISNAIICDLEKRLIIQDLSGYSYDTLIESYFDTDKYSEEVKRKIQRYTELAQQIDFTTEEKSELKSLKDYFENIPKYVPQDLISRLQELDV